MLLTFSLSYSLALLTVLQSYKQKAGIASGFFGQWGIMQFYDLIFSNGAVYVSPVSNVTVR